jgi:hypothetical protein
VDIFGEPEVSAHIDPLITLFSEPIRGQRIWVDEHFLDKIKNPIAELGDPQQISHERVLQGVLNLAFVDRYVLAPSREALGDLSDQLREAGFNILHLPQCNVSQRAGLKCRTLVVPL